MLRETDHPGQDRVAHGGGHVAARAPQHLGDVEGVATGDGVEAHGVDVVPGGPLPGGDRELGDGPDGEPGEVDAPHPGCRCRVAQQDPQPGGRRDLLAAVGHEDERVAAVDPPGEVAHEVQGRLVGPVDVLDDEDRGAGVPGAQHVEEGGEQLEPAGALGPGESGQLVGELGQRGERGRGG